MPQCLCRHSPGSIVAEVEILIQTYADEDAITRSVMSAVPSGGTINGVPAEIMGTHIVKPELTLKYSDI